jgi:predicted CoA-binding protein
MPTTAMDKAREFLALKRMALVGISRNEKDFSRGIYRELVRRGYDVVPVNPALAEVEGRPCRARIQDVRPPPEVALLLTSPERTEQVVRDCLEAGVRRVWMHRGVGPGAVSPKAVAFCEANGIEVAAGVCPFMALPGSAWPHRLHGFFRRRALRHEARVPSS